MRLFVRGDLDGYFGLALDNLVQLLLIDSLCRFVLDFPPELLYGRVLPGVAVSLLVGNLFYAWQAHRLAARTGRTDVCALPYGINTPSVVAYVFLVMLPVKIDAVRLGASPADAAEAAWRMGLVACLGSGLIEFLGAFVAEPVRRMTPRAALLSTLAGIAIGFISGVFLFRTFAHPVVGLTTFGIVLLVYFGRVRFRGGIPGGLVAVAVGTALAWATGLVKGDWPTEPPRFLPPVFTLREALAPLSESEWLKYLTVIVPMGLFNLIGSLQNIESAEAAGDPYPTTPSLAMNGVSTLAAAAFGSCFPTTIYIGHPGWKALGARAGYSTLNGLFFTGVCLFGLLGYIAHAVPIDAGMAIVLWIGIVITAQAFQATPAAHAPAVVVGLLPGIAAWAALLIGSALRAGRDVLGRGQTPYPFDKLSAAMETNSGVFLNGVFALDQGFIFTATILAATTVALIERRFIRAGVWCVVAAALSAAGFMHSYTWDGTGSVNVLRLAWNDWATGYAAMAACFFLAPALTEPGEGH
jgi:AGZA family xanthine/uracil permease-like MFS transporter